MKFHSHRDNQNYLNQEYTDKMGLILTRRSKNNINDCESCVNKNKIKLAREST